MGAITLLRIDPKPNSVSEIIEKINGKKIENAWITAKKTRNVENEVIISYYYEEDLEDAMKRALTGEDYYEVVKFLKTNGKQKVLKKVYCFLNLMTGILEIYRGQDQVTTKIKQHLEMLLNVKLLPVSLSSSDLTNIIRNHSFEITQALFKYVHGLWYTLLRGSHLENNEKFKEYMEKKQDSLRVISFRPKIRYLNGRKYVVTINGDKGTLKMSSPEFFKWRPRFEVRQIVFMIASTLGLF
jgi:hypothetical protein